MTFLTISELRERGWNDRLVRTILGKPDTTYLPQKANPGRPQGLYALSRVMNLENTNPEFRAVKDRRSTSGDRIKRYQAQKLEQINETIKWLVMPEIKVPFAHLMEEAHSMKGGFPADFSECRVAVALLLDRMKSLEAALDIYKWHSGIREARLILKRKLLDHIIKHYPDLEQDANDIWAECSGKGEKEP